MCQVKVLDNMADHPNRIVIAWQFRKRLLRFAKRRIRLIAGMLGGVPGPGKCGSGSPGTLERSPKLRAGESVRIKARQEIQKTLDGWSALRGCVFMNEMWRYCGTRQTVFKRVERFLDERDYVVKKVSGVVTLQDVFCEGTADFGRCDRSCFFFWKEQWLERL